MTTEASSEPKRKYIRLNPATWAEIESLWQVGEVTLAELSDRYGVSQRALQAHFHKHRIVKGEKSAAIAAAVKEEVFKEELDDTDLTVMRAKDVREAAYTNAVMVESLIMGQLQAVQKDPSQVLKAASAVKMLSLAAAGLERLHDLKWKALGRRSRYRA
jgi:DNA-binding transcriptional regulator YdaS (Cro superfamily)